MNVLLRLTNVLPRYRKHFSGNARVTLNGRDYLLGRYRTKASALFQMRIRDVCSGRGDESRHITVRQDSLPRPLP